MDKRIILSVAGSGKTSFLIDKLDEEKRFLIVTYTINNTEHIRECVIRRFGYVPKNITIYTYFEYLMAECYRPFMYDSVGAKGIDWRKPALETLKFKRTNRAFYINPQNELYHNRIALLCNHFAEKIARRIEKYYDCFFYDEAQDLDGHDYNLFLNIWSQCKIDVLIVGDFFQHTFSTSTDGNVNSTLYNSFDKYIQSWQNAGFEVDLKRLVKSHRCSSTITAFVREKVGIEIYSHKEEESRIEFLANYDEALPVIKNEEIPKLFFKDAYKYKCRSLNWGESKGLDDFTDVCIVLNSTTLALYKKDALKRMAPLSLKKFYVACTRARRNIYFVPQEVFVSCGV